MRLPVVIIVIINNGICDGESLPALLMSTPHHGRMLPAQVSLACCHHRDE
jgi:hypothetical protein